MAKRLGAIVTGLVLVACQPGTELAPPVPPAGSSPPSESPAPTSSPSISSTDNEEARHPCLRNLEGPAPLLAAPPRPGSWTSELDGLVRGADISVAVAVGDRVIYEHAADLARTPASNQKLLLSMALLDAFPQRYRARTVAVSEMRAEHLVEGGISILSGGDPTFGDTSYRETLGLRGSAVGAIARRIASRGVRVVRGDIVGLRSSMRADWDAPGWQSFVRQRYITRPTALSFNGNHVQRPSPELQVATQVKERLEGLGVNVLGRPYMEIAQRPSESFTLAGVISPPLIEMLGIMNRESNNFFAEVLGKKLALRCLGTQGTIAKGAHMIRRWAERLGVEVVAHDASGLSYANRVTARGMVRLLEYALTRPWGDPLRLALPKPGEGTLSSRLIGVRVRAKTGSLFNGSSALSGWVWLEKEKRWASFSIMSDLGSEGSAIADRVVERIEKLDL